MTTRASDGLRSGCSSRRVRGGRGGGHRSGRVAASERLRPDAVLLDVQLPDLDGFEVARRLAQQPDAPDVVLTSARSLSDLGVERLDGAGVRGFVAKSDLSGPALTAALSA